MSESNLSISSELHDRLSDRVEATNFGSVDQYAEFVLEEVLHQLDDVGETVDQEEVEDRLQALGYVE